MNPTQRLVVLVPTLFLVPLASAQRHKLNGPLATAYTTDVWSFDLAHGRILINQSGDLFTAPLNGSTPASLVYHQEPEEEHDYGYSARLTPNGQSIVMIDDLETTAIREFFSFAADGSSSPLKIAALGAGQYINDSKLSPDSRFVAYRVGAGGSNTGVLYSARVDGSQPAVALNGTGAIGRFEFATDSSHVLFLTENQRLYTVPIDGSAPPVSVHPPLSGVRVVEEFALAPVGGRVVYRVDFEQTNVFGVYSAPADASAPQVKLNVNGSVSHFEIAFDSAYVTYVGDEELDGVRGLYAAPIAGGPYTRFVAGEPGLTILSERISPDRSRMVYRAQHPGRVDLYSVPADGSAPPVNLTAALPGGDVGDFLVDPVSGRIAFGVYTGSGFALYGAANDGSTFPVQLSPPGAVVGVQADRFILSAGSRVVFATDNTAHLPFLPFALYSAPLDGSSPAVRLHPPLAGGSIHSFVLDGSRTQCLYRAEQDFGDVTELFSVPVDGSAPPALCSATRMPTTVGDVDSFVATPDGARVVYRAGEALGGGLYAVDPNGTGSEFLGYGTQLFQLTPDSQRVVYVDEYYGLVSARLDGMWPPPTTITSRAFLDSLGWRISPDSSRVVHVHQADFYSEPNRLFSTRLDGSGPSVELNVPRAISNTAGSVHKIVISPDSSRVVYAGAQETPGVIELYSAPLAGGAAPVKLSGVLVSGGDVRVLGLTVSADSSRAVYLADRDVNESLELYSVPLAGGQAPVELSALPAADRDALCFALSPDSARVVYVADQDANDVFELYSVPLAGGAAPIELSQVARADEDVSGGFDVPLVSPDSQWVVYRADHEQDGMLELYRVPLAGGAAPVRLTVGGTSELLQLTADGAAVLYAAPIAGGTGLFRVASSGGTAVRLSGELDLGWPPSSPSGPANQAPRVSVDASGRWVLFNAYSPHVTGVDEPFVAPMDGRSEPLPVCAPLAGITPTNVLGVFLPGTSSVVYMAEQEAPGVVELYHALPKRAPGFVRPK